MRMFAKAIITCIPLSLVLATNLLAQSITCLDRNIGMVLNNFSTRSVAESWYPKTVRITDSTVQWGVGDDRWYPEVPNKGADHLSAEITDPHVYKFKYNKNRNRLTVDLNGNGFRTGIIYYTDCTYSVSNSTNPTNAPSNAAAAYFKRMSLCDRKYVQQFLRGQGVYKGSVDGVWGRGTASGLNSIKKVGKLRGLTDIQTLKKLEKNVVCD